MWNLQQINDKEFKLKTSVKLIKDNTLTIECAEHRGGKYHLFLSFSTFSTADIKGMEISLSNTETFDFAPTVADVAACCWPVSLAATALFAAIPAIVALWL